MGRADFYSPGTWNAYCSLCGRKAKASWLVRNWQGFYRCPEHNEPRQPQDFVHGVEDKMSVPWAQLNENGPNNFVQLCTPCGQQAIADSAVADCAVSDLTIPNLSC